jgi:hypothetical protein
LPPITNPNEPIILQDIKQEFGRVYPKSTTTYSTDSISVAHESSGIITLIFTE